MATAMPPQREIASYQDLRRVVGWLGIGLPIVVALWGVTLCHCWEVQPSISDYYSLKTRDAFEGILFTIAWFLFAYEGYAKQDMVAAKIGWFLALCIALFPNSGKPWVAAVHFASAVGLFLILAYFSLFLFTRSKGMKTPRKIIRDRFYTWCGWIIVACIALIGVYYLFLRNSAVSALKPVFWLEATALWAFGVAWLIKGEGALTDRPEDVAGTVSGSHG